MIEFIFRSKVWCLLFILILIYMDMFYNEVVGGGRLLVINFIFLYSVDCLDLLLFFYRCWFY